MSSTYVIYRDFNTTRLTPHPADRRRWMSDLRKLFKVSPDALMLKTTLRVDAQPRSQYSVYFVHFFFFSLLLPPEARDKITAEFLERDVEVPLFRAPFLSMQTRGCLANPPLRNVPVPEPIKNNLSCLFSRRYMLFFSSWLVGKWNSTSCTVTKMATVETLRIIFKFQFRDKNLYSIVVIAKY